MAWVLSWDVHALTTAPLRLFDANIFYPVDRTLAFSVHLLGVLPIFAPFYLATGDALASYNALFLSSYALSGFTAFLLARYSTGRFWPSFVAGVMFAFAPYRLSQVSHLQLLNSFWTPLALIYFDRFLRTERWRDLAWCALFYWLQVLSDLYLAYMVTTALALRVAYDFLAGRRRLLRASALLKATVFMCASVAVLAPFHLPYLAVYRAWGAVRSLDEVLLYSPDVLAYLTAPSGMNDRYVSLLRPLEMSAIHEKLLFPGLLFPALAVIGAAWRGSRSRARRMRRFFLLLVATGVVLSLGPYLVAFGHDTRVPLPYLLLFKIIPGWNSMRVPARFVILALLGATPLVALGVARCSEWLRRRVVPRGRGPIAAPLAATTFLAVFFCELGWKPWPVVDVEGGRSTPAVYQWLAENRPGPIVELPFGLWEDCRYLFFSTVHWLPLVNGRSGFFPPTYSEIQDVLSELPARRAVAYAASIGLKAVVVHRDKLGPAAADAWGGTDMVRLASFGPDAVYAIPAAPVADRLRLDVAAPAWVPSGRAVTVALRLRSSGGRPWMHRAPYGRSRVEITWDDPRTGRRRSEEASVTLPLVVAAHATTSVGVTLHAPATAGDYGLQVSLPTKGLRAAARTVRVLSRKLPTSFNAPRLLAVRYVERAPAERSSVAVGEVLRLALRARNTGKALWIASRPGGKGEVRLAWRWLEDGKVLDGAPERAGLVHDVFPGQSHHFELRLRPPPRPGTYELRLGLVSERVTWFADVGSPPLSRIVTVTTPTVSEGGDRVELRGVRK